MDTNDKAIAALRLALAKFEQQHHVTIDLQVLSWVTSWSELVKVAVYKTGPDVSEVGTTWLESFASLKALRQFEKQDFDAVGGLSAFLPAGWPPEALSTGWQMYGMPYLSDTRLVYYRRDMLRQAGIDESSAFASLAQFTQTLDRLKAYGIDIPLVIPTTQQQLTLHVLASWVWGCNGQFIDFRGKHVLFHTAESRRGIDAYFNLRRYLVPQTHLLDGFGADEVFQRKSAAVTINGTWMFNALNTEQANPEVVENFDIAMVPGVPFVGGSDLVVWQHSKHHELASALVVYLTGEEMQTGILGRNGILPARLDALHAPPFTTNPHFQIISESLQQGKSFPVSRTWGLVEDKLVVTIAKIWAKLLSDPTLAVSQTVSKYLEPLARELNHSLVA